MKRILFLLLFFITSFTSAQTAVNSNYGDAVGSGSSIATHTTMSLTAGNSMIGWCKTGGAPGVTFTMTDNCGNTLTGIGLQNDATVGNTEFFYKSNISGGASCTVTCNFSTTESNSVIVVQQWSGKLTPIDVSTHGLSTNTITMTTTAYTTAHAAEVIFLCGSQANISNNTFNVGAFGGVTAANLVYDDGSGGGGNKGYGACESAVLSSTQTAQTATLTAPSQTLAWSYGLASFQVASGSNGQPCLFVICD